jgi:hypothetical protein
MIRKQEKLYQVVLIRGNRREVVDMPSFRAAKYYARGASKSWDLTAVILVDGREVPLTSR